MRPKQEPGYILERVVSWEALADILCINSYSLWLINRYGGNGFHLSMLFGWTWPDWMAIPTPEQRGLRAQLASVTFFLFFTFKY